MIRITIGGVDITEHITAAEVTMHHVLSDGRKVAPAGACPECARLPLIGAVVCSHGVAFPTGEMDREDDAG